MQFPTTPRAIYKKNPLKEVICQISFPKILALEERVPADFQTHISKRFPIAASRESTIFGVFAGGAQVASPRVQSIYEFTSEDRDTTLAVTSDFLAVTCRRYSVFGKFLDDVAAAVSGLQACYTIPFFIRVGLRYANVISKDAISAESLAWRRAIRPSLLGILKEEEVSPTDLLESSSSVVLKLPDGKLAIRHGLLLENSVPNGDYLLDLDAFTQDELKSFNDVDHRLRSFNVTIRNAFRWLTTEELHWALEPAEPAR